MESGGIGLGKKKKKFHKKPTGVYSEACCPCNAKEATTLPSEESLEIRLENFKSKVEEKHQVDPHKHCFKKHASEVYLISKIMNSYYEWMHRRFSNVYNFKESRGASCN